jgi:hypothetical protein
MANHEYSFGQVESGKPIDRRLAAPRMQPSLHCPLHVPEVPAEP